MNEIMTNYPQQNYDLQELINITGQTALNINQMSKQMGILTSSISTIQNDIGNLTNRMDTLENIEEITTTQTEMIVESARKRILQIIGDDPLEVQKYFRVFIQSLYKDTRKFAGLGSKIARTRKCDYQRCLNYIEAWNPCCGCAALRAKADANAKARLEARMLGYTN